MFIFLVLRLLKALPSFVTDFALRSVLQSWRGSPNPGCQKHNEGVSGRVKWCTCTKAPSRNHGSSDTILAGLQRANNF